MTVPFHCRYKWLCRIFLFVIALFATVIFTDAAQSAPDTAEASDTVANTNAAGGRKIKLIVWGLQSGKETAGLDAQVAEFERRHPNIDVSLLSMGAGNMNPQKLMTSIVGGVPPDVIHQDRFTIGDWASRDTFQPLEPYLAAQQNEPNPIRAEDYYPAAWKEAVYEGKVYAIPSGIDSRLLFYNRRVFREAARELRAAGLDPNRAPRTWEELKLYAKHLTKVGPDGTYQRVGFIPNYGNSWLYLYSWQNGGEFMSADGRTSTLNNKYSVGALQYMTEVYDLLGGYNKVKIFETGFQPNEQDPFYTGKIGMVINGSWVLNSIARYAPGLEFDVAPPPVPEERLKGAQQKTGRFAKEDPYITWCGGFSFAMPVGNKHPKEGWQFIKWMTSVEAAILANAAQKKYNESKGRPFVFTLSANHKVNEALLKQFPPENPRLRKAQKAFMDIMPAGKYRPVTFIGQKLWDAHVRAYDRGVSHLLPPQAAMDEQSALVQKELDKAFSRENLPFFSFAGPVTIIGILIICGLGVSFVHIRREVGNSRSARREALAGYLMAGPWLFGFIFLTGGPILASLLLAFCDYDVLHPPRYVGLNNFQTLFSDDRELLAKGFYNAAYISVIGIPLGIITGLSIAMLLNMKVKGMAWYRTAFYIPSIVPAIASVVLWSWLLAGDPSKGLLNALWKSTLSVWYPPVITFFSAMLSMPDWIPRELPPPGWFGVPEWAKPGLILQGLWGAGGGMILWLAGLQGVPQSLYEASQIDGARNWSQFRNVTLPLLSPYIFFQLIMGTIGALQEFDRVYVLGGGTGDSGPLDSLLVPVLYLFNNAFRYFKMGYASAIAWIIFVIILMLTLIQWKAQKYWVHYETEKS